VVAQASAPRPPAPVDDATRRFDLSEGGPLA